MAELLILLIIITSVLALLFFFIEICKEVYRNIKKQMYYNSDDWKERKKRIKAIDKDILDRFFKIS